MFKHVAAANSLATTDTFFERIGPKIGNSTDLIKSFCYALFILLTGVITPASANITQPDPLNTARTYSYTIVQGIPLSTGQTQPAGSGSLAASSAQTFDANGNTTSRKDFNGNTSCFAYDLTRNLETVRLEGLPSGTACPSNLSTYTPPAGSTIRKITTQWSASFRLPTLIAEPLRITTLTYDTKGNVLTRTVQPTTDATGGAGTGGTPSGTARTWTYTYYATSDASNGQLHTVDGPRTDVSDVTIFGHG